MNWLQLVLLLACPLMMIVCMRGMSHGTHGSKDKNKSPTHADDHSLQSEVQQLNFKMADMIEENRRLN
ncbi:DUF2933 domain-containing protein [Cohnella massiliensis]|uniref:DUF2933 domain-containing protein n=1 Tax=Cohnella massiliensis TaxID=1816691 RepID=UPI0009BA2222|nr:DUF2933 domain-containing protein [Cohnella massiliensis]